MGKKSKVQYTQKFRKEWFSDSGLKDWIEDIPTDPTSARCKYCKCTLNARYSDLNAHSISKKHFTSSQPFSNARQLKLPFKPVNPPSLKTYIIEASMTLFVTCHCAIHNIDHLTDLNKKCFSDQSEVVSIKLHRTKCSGIIKNILFCHFKQMLRQDIGDSPYSLLLDESTDISVTKQLGVCIVYYSASQNRTVSTYLKLETIDAGTAVSVLNGMKSVLSFYNLDLQNLRGIGTDNANVMVGRENGVFSMLLKEVDHLILIRCVCHSVQLSVSAAAANVLPTHLEFLLSETYNWFSKSTNRQLSYKQLYNAINNGIDPLKILCVAQTRWLSIEDAVTRILDQWLELKQHFKIAASHEKCYKAKMLSEMYTDVNNEAYLMFLKPILSEAQYVNKIFQSNNADPAKLLDSLILLIETLGRLITTPACKANLLDVNTNISDYLHPKPYLGNAFEEKMKYLSTNKFISESNEKILRSVCVKFIVTLINQLKSRLPNNIEILRKVSLFSPKNCLNPLKDSITNLVKLMKFKNVDNIEFQWRKLHLIQWINTKSTAELWSEIAEYRDASGENPFKELVELAKCLLVLPWSNGEVERAFSQMNIVKNSHRNRLSNDMTNSILTIRSGLRRMNKCCHDYEFPTDVIGEIGDIIYFEI